MLEKKTISYVKSTGAYTGEHWRKQEQIESFSYKKTVYHNLCCHKDCRNAKNIFYALSVFYIFPKSREQGHKYVRHYSNRRYNCVIEIKIFYKIYRCK